MKAQLNPLPKFVAGVLLAVLMLVALFLRLYELDRIPPGPFYDEAAATLLAGQVASGHFFPIFIPSYTGHEALYYYLTLPFIKLLGVTVLALRVTSALIGAASIVLAYLLARELFSHEPDSDWLGLFSAALMATSFWHVSVSRYGYRAITLPLMQSLLLLAVWHGQRHNRWRWIVAAGICCGLTAYTYLSSRIVPVALAILLITILLDDRSIWKLRLKQWGVLALVALIVAAPLGVFFITHPGTFFERTAQVSILDQAGWQTAALQNIGRVVQVFTLRGDPQIQFNLAEQPMFPGLLSLAFYTGLAVVITRLIYPGSPSGRAHYVLILTWPLVMLIPSALSNPQQIPHSLRSIGVMPLAFFIPALGLVTVLQQARRFRWTQNPQVLTMLTALAFGAVLIANATGVYDSYFGRWAVQPRLYDENNGDVADMARYLDTLPNDGRPVYVHMLNWYHPSVQVLTRNYSQIKWIQGDGAFVFPPGPAVYAWPKDSLPDETWAGRFFLSQARTVHNGPDGSPAFVIHAFERAPVITPTHALSGTFGGLVEAIGFDVLRDRPSGGKTDVAVYWRVLRKPEQNDLTSLASVSDDWGTEWGQSDSIPYPSSQWSPGEVIAQRVRIQTDDGTPPGNHYALKLGWWSPSTRERLPRLDAQGHFAGIAVAAGPITMTRRARALDLNAVNIPHRTNVEFDGLVLLGHGDWPTSLRQGESGSIALFWQARTVPLSDDSITVQMRNDGGQSILLSRSGPAHGTYPTSLWETNEFIADRITLRVPPDTAPGSYTLEVQVNSDPAQSIARFEVQGITRQWNAPATSHPLSVTLGAQIALVGYDVNYQPLNVRPASIEVTLHWLALRQMEQDYTAFVHLVDASGVVRSQHDGAPVNGRYPTSLWRPGEYVTDTHTFSLPPDLPPGDYILQAGLYQADTGDRLTATGNDDKITLDEINIKR